MTKAKSCKVYIYLIFQVFKLFFGRAHKYSRETFATTSTSRAHGNADLGWPLRSPRRGPRWRPRPAPFALESGLLCSDRTWTRAKSPRAEDGRVGCDTRAATCRRGCGSIAPTRAPLGRAEGGRRSDRASLLGQNTVGVTGGRMGAISRPARTVFGTSAGANSDRTWTRAKSRRAEDDRVGRDTRAATCRRGCGSIAPTRAPLGRAEGGRRSGRASLLDQNTVGAAGVRMGAFSGPARTVLGTSAGVNSSPLYPAPCL